MNVTGFSHITLNVSSLDRSIPFYTELLGMRLRHRGNTDAYLEWGTAWICLLEKPKLVSGGHPLIGMDHVAFHLEQSDFHAAVQALKERHVAIVRGPVERGGGWSLNFLDPDGIQLELHSGTLDGRMQVWK